MSATTARRLLTPLLTLLTLVALATPARASGGLYTYVACSNPDTGQGVLPADGMMPAGFSGAQAHTVGPDVGATRCGYGAMTASRGVPLFVGVPFTTSTPHSADGSLTFTAPPGLELTRAMLYRI